MPRRRESGGRIASRALRVKATSADGSGIDGPSDSSSSERDSAEIRERGEPVDLGAVETGQDPFFGGFSVRSHEATRFPAPQGELVILV